MPPPISWLLCVLFVAVHILLPASKRERQGKRRGEFRNCYISSLQQLLPLKLLRYCYCWYRCCWHRQWHLPATTTGRTDPPPPHSVQCKASQHPAYTSDARHLLILPMTHGWLLCSLTWRRTSKRVSKSKGMRKLTSLCSLPRPSPAPYPLPLCQPLFCNWVQIDLLLVGRRDSKDQNRCKRKWGG